jgi:glutathione S-transferase
VREVSGQELVPVLVHGDEVLFDSPRILDWLEARVPDDIRVSVARARLLEWRRRDPHAALAVVEEARRRMPEEAGELEARHVRLTRKISRRAARQLQLDAGF